MKKYILKIFLIICFIASVYFLFSFLRMTATTPSSVITSSYSTNFLREVRFKSQLRTGTLGSIVFGTSMILSGCGIYQISKKDE